MSRAVDETGYVQPFLKQLLAARGGNMGYHFNPVTAWYLQKDGLVSFKAT
jgi:sulfane dehydrogenase subunit SoxC